MLKPNFELENSTPVLPQDAFTIFFNDTQSQNDDCEQQNGTLSVERDIRQDNQMSSNRDIVEARSTNELLIQKSREMRDAALTQVRKEKEEEKMYKKSEIDRFERTRKNLMQNSKEMQDPPSIYSHIVEARSTNDVNEFQIWNSIEMQDSPLTQVRKEKENKEKEEEKMYKKLEMERTRKKNPQAESNRQGIHQDEISRKQAKKNSLQFLACQLGKFLEKDQQILSDQERAALQRLKQTPTHLEFNNLFTFQKQGCLVQGIAEFFQPHRLSQTILASKVRNYTYKLVYKKEANLLRKKFITSQNSFTKNVLSSDLPSEEIY